MPIFDFNMLFDTDFGIMSLVAAEMDDIDIFDHQWINDHSTMISMTKALYERKERNPLIQCTLSNDKKEIDELYDSFIKDEDYYSKVVQRSLPTEIYNLLERCFLLGDVQPYIVYQSDIELEHMKSFNACKKVPESNFINMMDIIKYPKKYTNKFTMYYCKHNTGLLLDAFASTYSYAKTYYIADYLFNNYESKPGTIDISSDSMQIITFFRCMVRSIDIYNRYYLDNGLDNNKEEDQSNGS